jgi:hypothetical protein
MVISISTSNDELPPGWRKPMPNGTSWTATEKFFLEIYSDEIATGRQIYIV